MTPPALAPLPRHPPSLRSAKLAHSRRPRFEPDLWLSVLRVEPFGLPFGPQATARRYSLPAIRQKSRPPRRTWFIPFHPPPTRFHRNSISGVSRSNPLTPLSGHPRCPRSHSGCFSSPFLRTPSPHRSLLACPTTSRVQERDQKPRQRLPFAISPLSRF
jgi:hypothetical protein